MIKRAFATSAVVIGVFFFWPAAQAILQSVQQQDAFGTSTEWVGFANFERIFSCTVALADNGSLAGITV